jgi:ribose transport system substrate-binding protein
MAVSVAAALAATVLAGCGGGSSATGAAAPAATEAPAATVAATAAQGAEGAAAAATTGGEKKVIGMLVKDASTEYIQAMIEGAQATADELGFELKVIDGGYDTMKFLDAINQYIMEEIDGFIIAAVEDPVAIIPGIEALNEKGIPVMSLDTCPSGGKVDMFITFDIVESTKRAATQMVEGLKAKNGGVVPEGVVIEITGALVDMFAQECSEGLKEALAPYPQLTIVQGEGKWFNDDAFARTGDLLTRYGDEVVAIYCQTPDIMGSGTVAAIENAGLDPADYFVSGICIGSEGREMLKSGKLYAVVEQPALDSAILAVRYLKDVFDGKPLPQVGDEITEEGALWSPAYIIENEDVDEGVTMILQGPLVPQDADPDDPLLWENILFGK